MRFSSVQRWVTVGGLTTALLLSGAGCAKQSVPKREITSLQRKEAATVVSEAEFAVMLRDHARAEGLYAKAAELAPDTGEYWVSLGSTQVRLGKKAEAKKSYETALAVYKDEAKGDKTTPPDTEAALQQVVVLALLGRADDARAVQAKLPEQFPADRAVKAFIESKRLDQMLADPRFKEVSL